jgi:hypothetical protein
LACCRSDLRSKGNKMWGQPPSAVRWAKPSRVLQSASRSERIHKSLRPQPRILLPLPNQPSPHGVFQQVLNLSVEGLRIAHHMVKRLGLPNPPHPTQSLVDPVCRRTLNRIHDRGERKHFHSFAIDKRREDQMNMIRHHHSNPQIEFLLIVMQARFQDDRPRTLR